MTEQAKSEPWKLNKKQLAHISEHIERFMKKGCWVCDESRWRLHPLLTGEKPYDPGAKFFAMSDSAPKVRITCENCGHVVYMSAEVMKLPMDDDEEEA